MDYIFPLTLNLLYSIIKVKIFLSESLNHDLKLNVWLNILK